MKRRGTGRAPENAGGGATPELQLHLVDLPAIVEPRGVPHLQWDSFSCSCQYIGFMVSHFAEAIALWE